VISEDCFDAIKEKGRKHQLSSIEEVLKHSNERNDKKLISAVLA
jgi:hypothetical protein